MDLESEKQDQLQKEFSITQKDAEQIIGNESIEKLIDELEKLVNQNNAGILFKKFSDLKQIVSQRLVQIYEEKKNDFEGDSQDFDYEHPLKSKFSALASIFQEQYDAFRQEQEQEYQANFEKREAVIERLKKLYTDTEPGVDLFKEIRAIKEEWANIGDVAKADFKTLTNNYYHHLNGFYQMLDLNKEYLEQEYAHNLEKRKQIIAHAEQLLEEPVVQKALNELQFLHKLWKDEAEPVAEEFRDETWERFKEISNKIHERKAELLVEIEKKQEENLEKKNQIIEQLRKIISEGNGADHQYWQNAIKKVERLRDDFIKTGSVPKKLSNQNWDDFKKELRTFNTVKNSFYKNLKISQFSNLEKKQQLLQTAIDNKDSQDWETAVPLFKNLQNEWNKIGFVPKNQANQLWKQFKESCNHFFKQYRESSEVSEDNWLENYKQKKQLLEELKAVGVSEDSLSKIEVIKNQWNAIGKVPKAKLSINSEFNKVFKEKLKINHLSEFDLADEGLSESQKIDKARKLKNQIADLEAEIVTLENNIQFFSNSSRENPLLKEIFSKVDEKREILEHLKLSLKKMINQEEK